MSFSFGHLADTHIGNYAGKVETGGFNGRFLDFVSTYNEAIDRIIADRMDFCLIPGDMFRTKQPGPDELDAFTGGIIKLIKNKIPIVTVLGNHDFPLGDKRAISFAAVQRFLDFVKEEKAFDGQIFQQSVNPEILTVKIPAGIVQIQTMPYPMRNRVGLTKTSDIEQWMIKNINDTYEKRDKNLPIIFAGHFSIGGAMMSGEQINIDKFSEPLIPQSVFKGKDYLYVAMGHLHQYQVVSKSPLIVYCGSTNRTDFNEAKEDKGFVEVEVADKVKHNFINLNARKFIDLKYDLSQESDPLAKILFLLSSEIDNIKGAVVRISVTLSAANKFKYDDGQVEAFLNQHCYHIHGTTIPNIKAEDAVHDIQGFAESMGIVEALSHYAEVKGIANKEQFIRLGEAIVKRVNGGNNAVPKL